MWKSAHDRQRQKRLERTRTILKLFGGQGTINVNSWAPDSKHFAYVRYEKGK
jgi:hypothetical protein